jgi:hypothetical protein
MLASMLHQKKKKKKKKKNVEEADQGKIPLVHFLK